MASFVRLRTDLTGPLRTRGSDCRSMRSVMEDLRTVLARLIARSRLQGTRDRRAGVVEQCYINRHDRKVCRGACLSCRPWGTPTHLSFPHAFPIRIVLNNRTPRLRSDTS